jgi:Rps23 Pro-64 3,4-dihydroxylase Tpa1-like proline 4-hydroxylase
MKIFDNYELGSQLHHVYGNSSPFPNIVIDNFLDSNCAHKCFSELKNHKTWGCELPDNDYVNPHQVNKFFTPYDPSSLEDLFLQSPTVFGVLQHLNSPKFVNFLSNLTGIKGLIPDPDFFGAGCHRIQTGGRLSLHVDYNLHNTTNSFRVLNLLLYLNPQWFEEWGGHLELWDLDKKKLDKKISPIMNRAVIFTLSDKSVHGHPHPLKTPIGIDRYSLALYYFIKEPNQEYYPRNAVVWHEF